MPGREGAYRFEALPWHLLIPLRVPCRDPVRRTPSAATDVPSPKPERQGLDQPALKSLRSRL